MLHKEPDKPVENEPVTPPQSPPSAKPPDDELMQCLRAAAKKKRPWGVLTWLLTLVLIGIPAGLLAWLFWPRTLPPELLVTGFDVVASVGNQAILRAATEPAHGHQGDERKHWAGQIVYFQEVGQVWDKREKLRQAPTNAQGIAELTWPAVAQAGTTIIEVLYVDERRFRRWYDRTQIRLFTWPRDSRVLVIDGEPTLRHVEDWTDLAKALADAEQSRWHIVYLATNADTPAAYNKMRGQLLEQISLPKDALVSGPVLARLRFFAGDSPASAHEQILAQLKKEFSGTMLFLDSSNGLKLHKVEPSGGFSGDAAGVDGWNNLEKALGK